MFVGSLSLSPVYSIIKKSLDHDTKTVVVSHKITLCTKLANGKKSKLLSSCTGSGPLMAKFKAATI
jgi:hypothetical protein